MTAIPYDTLLFVETLVKSGVNEKHAKAISAAVLHSYKTAEFVTKTDFHHEISDLRKDMNAQFAAIDTKLENLPLQLTIRITSIIGGILIACASALGILLKALFSASL